VIDVVCDASVVLKWFHSRGESQVQAAVSILAAHRSGRINVSVLDLTLYELGNVLLRSLRWSPIAVADQLDDLRAICNVVVPTPAELRAATDIASRSGLTFYDSAYVAVAKTRGSVFVTADGPILSKSLGESADGVAARLGLTETV
jgi:predicted nucleic acid-binding protein